MDWVCVLDAMAFYVDEIKYLIENFYFIVESVDQIL